MRQIKTSILNIDLYLGAERTCLGIFEPLWTFHRHCKRSTSGLAPQSYRFEMKKTVIFFDASFLTKKKRTNKRINVRQFPPESDRGKRNLNMFMLQRELCHSHYVIGSTNGNKHSII